MMKRWFGGRAAQARVPVVRDPDGGPVIGSVWRHRKGGLYVVTGACRLEATDEDAVLYTAVGGGGPIWARAQTEFLDGRFTELDAGGMS